MEHRRVIRITAEDSPNVKRGLAQRSAGQEPDNRDMVPGVLSYAEYLTRRATWSKFDQCVGLDAKFFKGGEAFLFPHENLVRAQELAKRLTGVRREAQGIGIDAAEGGDKTALAAVDDKGLIELLSLKTANTAMIPGMVIEFGVRHRCPAVKWFFDRGGGGQQHADRLRDLGYGVKTVAFGESAGPEPKRGLQTFDFKVEKREEQYVYVNRRAEMYHKLSLLLDPALNPVGFAIGAENAELLRQLSLVPKMFRIAGTDRDWSMWDGEGRIRMLPKAKRGNEPCLTDLIGHSPDEADALVLAVHATQERRAVVVAGSAI